ncbi:helix-turn-helix transcriptional regulator [Streptomyces sp. NPDC046853]|uniref:helix-turn-helix domain-containing protein n=1 Tax=Streptomyces sp. NPDC046853 TaxID=3154920 RepID=UPI0033C31FF3
MRLRRARLEQQMSLRELAARTGYSASQLSKVENRRVRPSEMLARQCDAALALNGELLGLLVAGVESKDGGQEGGPTSSGDRYRGWSLSLKVDGASELFRLSDHTGRDLPDAGPPLMRYPAPRISPSAGQRVEGHAFEALSALHENTRALGRTASPGVVLPLAISQAHTLRSLARDVRGADRRQLLALGVKVFEHTGWMAQEAGDDSAALWWTDDAVHVAAELGDLDMPRYALIRRALVMYYQRRPARTIDLAGRVLDDSAAPPHLRWMAAQRSAQGHALHGDHVSSMRALELADRLRESAGAEAPRTNALGPAFAPGTTTLITGWCLYDSGRPAQAVEALRNGLAHIPVDGHRARARFTARLALALAANRELEEAAVCLDMVLGHVRRVDSATVQADLVELNRVLSRWPGTPAVRALRPQLDEALRSRDAGDI